MGKFSDALNKAGAEKKTGAHKNPSGQTEAPPVPSKSIAMRNGHIDPLLVTFLEPHTQASENFKLLASKLLSINSGREKRVLMVTSAQPLDGKSTVAANLAVVIAQELNKYAVLLDCDLRTPSLHKLLGLEPSEGIHEYLARGTTVESYMQKTPVKRLTLIQGGRPSPNPSDLLSSDKMRALITELRERYQDRYLVADFPPAGLSADTNFLADTVDAVLLVARAGKTPKDILEDTIDRIGRERILGVVFNEDGHRRKGYYKGYYRKRGRK